MERGGEGPHRCGILCTRRSRLRGCSAARDHVTASICVAQGGAAGPLGVAGGCDALFVPVVAAPASAAAAAKSNGTGSIAIEIAGVVVRAEPGVDLVFLRDVLRAVKAAT